MRRKNSPAGLPPVILRLELDEERAARILELAIRDHREIEQEALWLIRLGLERQAIEDAAAELLLYGWPLIREPGSGPTPENVVRFKPRPD